jgi:DNA-binding winged helix-turn-helix (wHTH) protein
VCQGIQLDSAARRLWRDGVEHHLTRKAFDLLTLLVERRPAAVSKGDIHAQLWPDTFVSEVTLHSLMSELRRVLGDDAERPRFIRTVHGFGYAFVGPVESPDGGLAVARPVRGWLVSPTGRVNLFDGDNLLGRDLDDVIDVPSPTVSRRHAAIRFTGEAWLEDLGSKNGTFVGDLRVTQPVRLADGDRVRLGAVLLTFKLHRTNGAASTQSLSSPAPGGGRLS